MNKCLIALVYALIPDPYDGLERKGYTHTVVLCDRAEYAEEGHFAQALDFIDFKNEFAARTYADAVNMGLDLS